MMVVFDPENDKLDYRFSYNVEETLALKQFCNRKKLKLDDVRRIALWKLNRIVDIPEVTMLALHEIACAEVDMNMIDNITTSLLVQLTRCQGVGFPMASTILKFIRPDIFPIIDVRAYRALTGKNIRKYSPELYCGYARQLRNIAEKSKRALADIDEQLYCFDKQKNGPLNGHGAAK